MSKQSKYGEFRNRRPPHARRSRQVPGSGDDDNKFFRCRFCNFINDIDRNSIGDGEGLSYSISTVTPEYTLNDSTAQFTIGTRGEKFCMASVTGKIFSERHNVAPDATSGCSFCGSKNYR